MAGEFAGDLLERFGVEDFGGLGERSERGPGHAQLLLHLLKFAGLPDAAERGDNGIEEEEEEVGAVMVVEESPVAGAVACGADVVKSFEQRHEAVEVFESDDVAIAEFGLGCGHAVHDARRRQKRKRKRVRMTRIIV